MRVVLLAGGKSKRMGEDKLFLPFQGKPLLQWMIEKLVNANFTTHIITSGANQKKIGKALPLDLLQNISIFQDVYPDKGPIGGIYSGLFYSYEPYIFVLAADLPFFKPELMLAMEKEWLHKDALIPQTEKGYEPLFAIYAKSCQAVFLKMIQENNLKISNSYGILSARIFPKEKIVTFDPGYQSFININTREDYEEIIRLE
jgi:molybdopterin-guanine dinucleotide biosynthesis protein A